MLHDFVRLDLSFVQCIGPECGPRRFFIAFKEPLESVARLVKLTSVKLTSVQATRRASEDTKVRYEQKPANLNCI